MFDIASRLPYEMSSNYHGAVACWATEGKVRLVQLDAIVEYVKKDKNVTASTLESECGVGQTVSEVMIHKTIDDLFASKAAEITEKRYQMFSVLHGELRRSLRWADKSMVNQVLNDKLLATLGPKTKNEPQKVIHKPKIDKKSVAVAAELASTSRFNAAIDPSLGFSNARIQESIGFPKPNENK